MTSKPLSPDLDKIEMRPDAWALTERAIKAAAKTPAQPSRKAKRKRSVVRKAGKR